VRVFRAPRPSHVKSARRRPDGLERSRRRSQCASPPPGKTVFAEPAPLVRIIRWTTIGVAGRWFRAAAYEKTSALQSSDLARRQCGELSGRRAGSRPAVTQNRPRRECGSWKAPEPAGLGPTAHAGWEAERPLRRPGMAADKSRRPQRRPVPSGLSPGEHAGAGYGFLIFSRRDGRLSCEPKAGAQSGDRQAASLFILRIRIGRFFDVRLGRKLKVRASEGARFVDAEDTEGEVDIYHWTNGSYRWNPIDY